MFVIVEALIRLGAIFLVLALSLQQVLHLDPHPLFNEQMEHLHRSVLVQWSLVQVDEADGLGLLDEPPVD